MKEHPDETDDFLGRLVAAAEPLVTGSEERKLRTKAEVLKQWEHRVHERKRKKLLQILAAAAVVIATGTAILFYNDSPSRVTQKQDRAGQVQTVQPVVSIVRGRNTPATPLGPNSIIETGSVLSTDSGGRALLDLAGGLSLRLDTNTVVRIDSKTVFFLESGAVYFDSGVSGPVKSAIRIATRWGIVSHTGTQFEVRILPDSMRLRVREGFAELSHQDVVYSVQEGSELFVDSQGSVRRSSTRKYGEDWGWVTKISSGFRLEGRSLMDFLIWICRENGWSLQFNSKINDRSKGTVLHGSIEKLSPDEMLRTVVSACGLKYALKDGVLRIDPQ